MSNVMQVVRMKPLSLLLLPGDNDSNYISESQKSKVTYTTAVTFNALASFFVCVVMCVPLEVKGSSVLDPDVNYTSQTCWPIFIQRMKLLYIGGNIPSTNTSYFVEQSLLNMFGKLNLFINLRNSEPSVETSYGTVL